MTGMFPRKSALPPFADVLRQVQQQDRAAVEMTMFPHRSRVFTPAPTEEIEDFGCMGNPFCTCQHFGYGCSCAS